ncbi:MAG: OadG family protein [Acetatifactor sp.]|nr:OadG family protein [Acetatifactor sp.]
MKKIVALLCTLLCVLSLAACAETEEEKGIKQQAAQIQQDRITLITSGLFLESVQNADLLSDSEVYPKFVNFGNEELEAIFNTDQASFLIDGHGLKTVVESFKLSKQQTGALKVDDAGNVMLGTVTAEVKGQQIIAHAEVQCERGNADIEMIYSNDLFCKLEGGSLNAKSTFGELMEKAGLNTLIGMGTVFAVLILISLIIALFGLIPKIQAAFSEKEEEPKKPVVAQTPVAAPTIAEEEDDDTELVAVIAAAIAAYEGSTNTDGFVVRSIRRR